MKTLGMLIAGLFGVHTVLMAQDHQVRVQSSPGIEQQNYSSFYFLEAQEIEFQEGTEMEQRDRMDQTEGMRGQDHQRGQDQQMGQNHQMEHDHHMRHEGMARKADDAIRNAILHEMVSRGFEIDTENPDLLVSYKVFDQSAEISGFTQDDAFPGVGTQMPETVEAGEGSILITVTDRESGEMISRGLLSEALSLDEWAHEGEGVFEDRRDDRPEVRHDDKPRAEKYNKKVEVIQAVSSIFEQLQLGGGTLGAGR
jgi:hypothetical protein